MDVRTELDWYPKRFQPGDMDASGGDQLLGRPALSQLEVLIRETAQNSWDAKLDGIDPEFGMALRRTTPAYREQLARLLSGKRFENLGGHERTASFRVLEVWDRGTVGLDGPSDLSPVPKGRSARFQDLILKLGVPHNDGTSGGTYGYGKTAAFAYSGLGLVIYWTRCRNLEGKLEHRFIASALASSYVDRGVQFTGRHWWGIRTADGEGIEPVVGDEAKELGERFFLKGFGRSETGTSILILDPLVTDTDDVDTEDKEALDRHSDPAEVVEADFSRRARAAIRVNLWPKLVRETPEGQAPMSLSLNVAGEQIPLGDPDDGAFGCWGAGLNAIRRLRAGDQTPVRTPSGFPVKVEAITRYGKTIGHLAIIRRIPSSERASERDALDPIGDDSRVSRIALMRGQAELIVTTVDWVDRELDAGAEWLAVYKSADEFDHLYAKTEPPAHEDWVFEKKTGDAANIVRHTRKHVIRILKEELFPEAMAPAEPSAAGPIIRTGGLSRRLGALLPAPAYAPPEKADVGSGTGRRRNAGGRRSSIEADSPRLVETFEDGRQRQEIGFRLDASTDLVEVQVGVSLLGDDGLNEPVDPSTLDLEWSAGTVVGAGRALLSTGEDCWVRFTGAPRRALRVSLTEGGGSGRP